MQQRSDSRYESYALIDGRFRQDTMGSGRLEWGFLTQQAHGNFEAITA